MNRKLFLTAILSSIATFPLFGGSKSKPKTIQSKQKFLRGQRVRISDVMPNCMRHFECGCEAIVVSTYRETCGRHSYPQDYTLLILNVNGEPSRSVSWYEENQLTLINSDRDSGEQLIQTYLDNLV